MPKVRLKKQLFFTLQLSHLDLTPFDSPFDSQNKGKGGKNRRRGKNENDDDKRELVFREDGQEYAQVTKMLGNGRLEALCFDGEKRLAHIRGKMRKKVRSNCGDLFIVCLFSSDI